jgi:hypothetical protein
MTPRWEILLCLSFRSCRHLLRLRPNKGIVQRRQRVKSCSLSEQLLCLRSRALGLISLAQAIKVTGILLVGLFQLLDRICCNQFDRSLQMVESSSLSQEIKDNAKLLHHYNLCGLAIGKKDYAAAQTHAEEYRQGAEASKNPAQVKLAHELAGRIALAQKE